MKKSALHTAFFSLLFVMLALFSLSAQAASLGETQITSSSSTSSSISLAWKKVTGADGYKIYEYKNGKYIGLKKTADCKAQISGFEPNTEHTICIRAYSTDKNGVTVHGKLNKITVKTKLADIKNLQYINANATAIKVGWSKVSKAEYYKIAIAPVGQSKYVNVGKTTDCKYTVKGLDGNKGYKIRVVAVGNGNRSEYTRILLYTEPEATVGLKVTNTTYNTATLKWEKTGSANKYYVYACKTENGKYTFKGTTDKTSITVSLSSVSTKYYFKVRAAVETKNQKSVGVSCKAVSATTKAYPFEISLPSKSVRRGEYIYLSVPHYKNITWSSSNTNVISLKGSRAYANSVGTATITAKSGSRKASVKITVSDAVTNYISCVYDYTNSKWVFSNRLYDRCYPASITKLITALVTLKYMDVNETIYVGSELNMVEPLSSRCGIQKGEKFRLGDLLYGLLLPSGGDAAYTIAVNCARKVSGKPNMGYVEAKNYFVSLMNSYMKSLGAVGTHCVNPHGYPVDGHYSTAYDLVLVAKQVLKNPTLKKITSTQSKYVTALTGKGRTWRSTNLLLNPSSGFYSPYAHGMKTGTVTEEYTGIVSAATKNGRTIITVAIGCESFNARYNATYRLYNAYL